MLYTPMVERALVRKRIGMADYYRNRLSREDFEDLFQQASLEVWVRYERKGFRSLAHFENSLEQKFASRYLDFRRACSGRSLARTVEHRQGPCELDMASITHDPVRQAIWREEMRCLCGQLREKDREAFGLTASSAAPDTLRRRASRFKLKHGVREACNP